MIAVDAYYDGMNVQSLNQVDKKKNKKSAFNQLEALREKNKHFFTDSFDWKKS